MKNDADPVHRHIEAMMDGETAEKDLETDSTTSSCPSTVSCFYLDDTCILLNF